jgi:Protein of unknown function, DUF481
MLRFAIALCLPLVTQCALAQELAWPGAERLPLPLDVAPFVPPPEVAPLEAVPAPPGGSAAAPAPPVEAESFLVPPPGWEVWSPNFWDPWEGNVELGMSGTEGNAQTFNVRFGMTAKHKTPLLVQTLQITSIQKSVDGLTTANTALIDGRIEWPMPNSRWNYYLHGLTEYDQFRAFNYRFSADSGFGYEFIQNARSTLIGRSGLSVSKEVGGNDGEVKPELALGGEFKHKFNLNHSISAKIDYFPNVTDFRDFRLNSQASWEIALSHAWGLSLKFSVIDRYDATPQGALPNDLDYSTLVLWQF